ncbi:hypothetical protein BDZ97DRAFT_1756863 [Flammula alnicola]|nr:hypothetical protein BDZ97DRAFT_1756863 [Flammula alnicola]
MFSHIFLLLVTFAILAAPLLSLLLGPSHGKIAKQAITRPWSRRLPQSAGLFSGHRHQRNHCHWMCSYLRQPLISGQCLKLQSPVKGCEWWLEVESCDDVESKSLLPQVQVVQSCRQRKFDPFTKTSNAIPVFLETFHSRTRWPCYASGFIFALESGLSNIH